MKRETKIKSGTLVRLSLDLRDKDMFGSFVWATEKYFLRDEHNKTIVTNICVQPNDLCIVIRSDRDSILIATPKGNTGWINKSKMEIVK